jgi:hypothetical protein
VLLGFIHTYDLPGELDRFLEINNPQLAASIAEAIQAKILAPIAKEVDASYRPPEEKPYDGVVEMMAEYENKMMEEGKQRNAKPQISIPTGIPTETPAPVMLRKEGGIAPIPTPRITSEGALSAKLADIFKRPTTPPIMGVKAKVEIGKVTAPAPKPQGPTRTETGPRIVHYGPQTSPMPAPAPKPGEAPRPATLQDLAMRSRAPKPPIAPQKLPGVQGVPPPPPRELPIIPEAELPAGEK